MGWLNVIAVILDIAGDIIDDGKKNGSNRQ